MEALKEFIKYSWVNCLIGLGGLVIYVLICIYAPFK
jgi:hypothetical protein